MPSLFSLREVIAPDNFADAFSTVLSQQQPRPFEARFKKPARSKRCPRETPAGRPGRVGSGPRRSRRDPPRWGCGLGSECEGSEGKPRGPRVVGPAPRPRPVPGYPEQLPSPSREGLSELGERCRPTPGLQPGREAREWGTGDHQGLRGSPSPRLPA